MHKVFHMCGDLWFRATEFDKSDQGIVGDVDQGIIGSCTGTPEKYDLQL